MKVYSKILGKHYDPENAIYIANILQIARYMKNGADEFLVDILYDNTKRPDTLVFVFEKAPEIQELYRKWNAHELI